MTARGAAPTALLLASRMRHAEGDLTGARAAFDAMAGSGPDKATTGLAYLGLLLEHGDAVRRTPPGAGPQHRRLPGRRAVPAMLASCFAAALACANLGDLQVRSTAWPCWSTCWPRSGTSTTLGLRPPPGPGSGGAGRPWPVPGAGRPGPRPARPGRHRHPPGLHAQLSLAETFVPACRPPSCCSGRRQLARPFGYRWRVELHRASWPAPRPARRRGPARTGQGLWLNQVPRPWPWPASTVIPEAAELAAASGSDYLLAQVAPPAQARAASDRIAAALPAEPTPSLPTPRLPDHRDPEDLNSVRGSE